TRCPPPIPGGWSNRLCVDTAIPAADNLAAIRSKEAVDLTTPLAGRAAACPRVSTRLLERRPEVLPLLAIADAPETADRPVGRWLAPCAGACGRACISPCRNADPALSLSDHEPNPASGAGGKRW